MWWLASQADRPPETRTAPTRIWWVVNRCLLVDSTTEHAEAIANALRDPDSLELDRRATAVLASIAHRLRSLSADPGAAPLEVIRLRGGIASRTPTDPSRPAILLCTLPMYGSRLLFRGYGSTLRAVDAAMAGTDSLVLLDEAHLAPHLRALFPAVADCTPGAQAILGEARSSTRLVTLTATGDDADGQPFGLDDEDEAHPVVRQRLDAAKFPTRRCRTLACMKLEYGVGADAGMGAALLRWRPNQSLRRRRGRRQLDPSRPGEERRRVRWPTVLLSSATDGGLPLVLARFVRGLSTHQGSGCPRRLRTAATAAKCHRAPVDSHRVADQMPTGPSMSWRRAPHAASPLPRG